MKEVTCVAIRRAAMNLLARREYSRLELSTRLVKQFRRWKTLDAEALESGELEDGELDDGELDVKKLVAQALARLATEGLQSDTRLAETFIRARANKGQGPVKIRAELESKGVAVAVISAALENSGVNWHELAETVSLKKFGPKFGHQGPTRLQDKARVARFLRQRGFTLENF